MKNKSQQGVALVITLVLLSVITFMAVTFLVVSRRERESVSTLSNQRDASLAAEAAQESAIGQLVAQMLATTNGQNFGLLVSTNFESPLGFISNLQPIPGSLVNITNVGYNYTNGTPLNNANNNDLFQNLANLQILPRPPVFVYTNRNQAAGDFRFYLDLNRNGVYDTNGSAMAYDENGNPLGITNFVGDPEWIGILNRPEYPHSRTNLFTARYAFLALPIGNSLDMNYIHNQAKFDVGLSGSPTNDAFLRNQGVGSWEINLAGFLYFLNTNQWGSGYQYQYTTNQTSPSLTPSGGNAFIDAASIVNQRYSGNYSSLSNASQLFGPQGTTAFNNDDIDRYSLGVLGINTHALPTKLQSPTYPWPGADNSQHYFESQDLFKVNPPANAVGFSSHLLLAGVTNATPTQKSTYDRYTFYNLLSQMSWESAPESGKLNLNYKNVNGYSATNFVGWNNPLEFFTNAVNRLLADNGYTTNNYSGLASNLCATYIPIYPTNYYTPSVHRLLQLAANIYDAGIAATNHSFPGASQSPGDTNAYPTVFRPTFAVNVVNGTNNIYINGYVESVGNLNEYSATPYSLPDDVLNNNLPIEIASVNQAVTGVNIYGIPWIIGAKKGFPNFNELSLANISQITRKLLLTRTSSSANPFTTNQMYIVGISNALGVEMWNSYTNPYPRTIDVLVTNDLTMSLTNENATANVLTNVYHLMQSGNLPYAFNGTTISPGAWSGFNGKLVGGTNLSFQIPLNTNVIFLPDSEYSLLQERMVPVTTNFETLNGFPIPHLYLSVTNRLRAILRDTATGRILDYVQLGGMNAYRDLMNDTFQHDPLSVWQTNRVGGGTSIGAEPYGIANQILISLGTGNAAGQTASLNYWNLNSLQTYGSTEQADEIAGFQDFYYGRNGGQTNLSWQVPFTPTTKYGLYWSLQANDPLVHYTMGDLTSYPMTNQLTLYQPPNATGTTNTLPNLGMVNTRYTPWGDWGNPLLYGGNSDTNQYNIALKDPAITNSDSWEFPTNRFPTLGWLGRVHRGTPWQTVYLKSAPTDTNNWQSWSGNTPQFYSDAYKSLPTNDWRLFDVFTTAPNDNATRGQLSVNQPGTAAWAAIFQGMITLTNDSSMGSLQPVVIDPIINYSAFSNIVASINTMRNNDFGQVFTNAGGILSVPQLTVSSPFLNYNGFNSLTANGINDAAIERIPEQMMSLVKLGTPRYVIYAYGQSLAPAPNSIVTSGPYFGMCTNYQITGEVLTRAVVRIDNVPMPGSTSLFQPHAVVESFNVLPPE